jgi:hypothetical protein
VDNFSVKGLLEAVATFAKSLSKLPPYLAVTLMLFTILLADMLLAFGVQRFPKEDVGVDLSVAIFFGILLISLLLPPGYFVLLAKALRQDPLPPPSPKAEPKSPKAGKPSPKGKRI